MRIAKDPISKLRISVSDFIINYGHGISIEQLNSRMQSAICPFCDSTLNIVAEGPERIAHFSHYKNSGFCPSKEPASEPYLPLPPNPGNPEDAKKLRQAFRKNWTKYYRQLDGWAPKNSPHKGLIPYFHVEEFIELLNMANSKNIWQYRGIRETDLPYLFVILRDYPPQTGQHKQNKKNKKWEPKRKYWFRFWYDASLTSMEDLWIQPQNNVVLFRASFIAPKRKKSIPKYKDIMDFYPIPRSVDFLKSEAPSLPPYITKKVEEWFQKHPSFNLDD